MAGSADVAGRFVCSGCGKGYAWKAELAGKRVKCKCGAAISVPASMPGGNGTPVKAAGEAKRPVAKVSAPKAVGGSGAKAPSSAAAGASSSGGKLKQADVVKIPRAKPQAEAAGIGLGGEDEGAPPGFEDLFALAGGTPVEEEAVTPPPLASVAAGAACPSCKAAVSPGAVICVNCGHNLKTGKKLKTQAVGGGVGGGGGGGRLVPALAGAGAPTGILGYAGSARRQSEARGEGDAFFAAKDLYVPIGMVVLGFALTFVEVIWAKGVDSIGLAIGVVGVMTIINFALVFAGVLAAVRLFDLGLGPVQIALLKIAGVSMIPGAVAAIVERAIDGPNAGFGVAGFVGWFVSYVLTLALFVWQLEMDLFESMMCSALIWIIRTWVGYALVAAIFSLGGVPGGQVGALAMGGNAAPPVANPAYDEWVNAMESPRDIDAHVGRVFARTGDEALPEARAWLAAKADNHLHKRDPAQSLALVSQLYGMGAVQVRADEVLDGKEAVVLLIELPPAKEKARRKPLLDWMNALDKANMRDPHVECGQKYLQVWLRHANPEAEKMKDPKYRAGREDEQLGRLVGRSDSPPAKGWLADRPGRVLQGRDAAASAKLVDEALGLGAENVAAWLIGEDLDEATVARAVVVVLPEDVANTKPVRQKVFAWTARLQAAVGAPVSADHGQRYVMVPLAKAEVPKPGAADPDDDDDDDDN
ncbi:MAG TPA: hypothetical protein VEA69_07380 [Tepidisphaeraceae bacterium]|nr:hypothetical protein [Tepidisphaeraceae bacterium]